MCLMCSCFFDAIQARLGSNLELSSAFGGKFEGGTDKKAAAKSEKLFNLNVKDARFWLASNEGLPGGLHVSLFPMKIYSCFLVSQK